MGEGTSIRRGEFTLTWDPAEQRPEDIHAFLTRCYWAAGIPLETVRRSMGHSLCFGILTGGRQVGFSRVVTDRTTFAYLCDVYVLEEYRGRGLASWMLETVLAHPDLQGLRRFCLATRDAHTLYARFGFTALAKPESYMEIKRKDL
jgi:GNAT superfamily N-acetyltransferase